MPTPNDFIAAVAGKDPALLEGALVKRVPYVFAEGESLTDFVAEEDGDVTLALISSDTRSIFWLDPDDASSAHDGVSVIVTSDGYRYHATDFRWPTSLKAVAQNTPGTETLGFAYHIGAAPTGDWSSNANDIAIWTSRGWVFLAPPTGQIFLNEADDLFYFMSEGGVFGTVTFTPATATVRDTALIGGTRLYIVENQTTNTPPTPTIGVYHIVGPSPTGDWSGHAAEIATSYDGSTFTFITPTEGVKAYDKDLNADYTYNSGWISSAGAWIAVSDAFTASGSEALAGTNTSIGSSTSNYNYSASVAPTTAAKRRTDSVTLSHTARRAATRSLRFQYSATAALTVGASSDDTPLVLALFRDSETDAIAWCVCYVVPEVSADRTTFAHIHGLFLVDAPDTSAHTYTVGVTRIGAVTSANQIDVTALTRRSFQIEEKF